MLTQQFKTSMAKACDIAATSDDAIIEGVEVRAINTVAGKRWKVAVVYDFGDGDVVTNRHGIPLYIDRKTAFDAASDVAAYISTHLGCCRIPVYAASLCDDADE